MLARSLPVLSSSVLKTGSRSAGGLLCAGPRVRCRSSSSSAFESVGPPEEVRWSKERVNSVQLIGNVGKDPEIRYLESGVVVGNFSLAVSQRVRSTAANGGTGGFGASLGNAEGMGKITDWYRVEVWGDVAKQTEQYVRRGKQLYIEGNLRVDSWIDKKTDMEKSLTKVIARAIYFVAPYDESVDYRSNAGAGSYAGNTMGDVQPAMRYQQDQTMTPAPPIPQQRRQPTQQFAGGAAANNTEDMWRTLFENPQDFFDNRTSKVNEKQPDFKSAKTGAALWLSSRNTPDWVFDELAVRESEGSFKCIRTKGAAAGGRRAEAGRPV